MIVLNMCTNTCIYHIPIVLGPWNTTPVGQNTSPEREVQTKSCQAWSQGGPEHNPVDQNTAPRREVQTKSCQART